MRISDWSSDVCSSDLLDVGGTVGPKIRRSGLYEVRAYEWRGHAQAEFDVRIPADEDPARGRSIGTPWLGYAIGDARGLCAQPRRRVDGRAVEPATDVWGQRSAVRLYVGGARIITKKN